MACCDKELAGKTLKEGSLVFEAKESFYKGELIAPKKLAELLEQANNINLLGEKAVGVALKQGYLNEKDIKRIEGVPHAQIVKLG